MNELLILFQFQNVKLFLNEIFDSFYIMVCYTFYFLDMGCIFFRKAADYFT